MKICLVLLALAIVGAAAPLLKNPETVHTLRHQGRDRAFRIFSPAGEGPGSRAQAPGLLPVVLALHGGATDGLTLSRYTGLSEKAVEAGFVVVYPDGTGRLPRVLTWNSGECCGYARDHGIDDVGFLRRVAAFAVENYGGDPDRIYVTGISNGAMMAYRLAAQAPDLVAEHSTSTRRSSRLPSRFSTSTARKTSTSPGAADAGRGRPWPPPTGPCRTRSKPGSGRTGPVRNPRPRPFRILPATGPASCGTITRPGPPVARSSSTKSGAAATPGRAGPGPSGFSASRPPRSTPTTSYGSSLPATL